VVYAVLAQLVGTAGVAAQDITVYDATEGRSIGAPIIDKVRADPSLRAVRFVVGPDRAGDGRIAATPDLTAAVHFAGPGIEPAYLPRTVTGSKYLITWRCFARISCWGSRSRPRITSARCISRRAGPSRPAPCTDAG